MKRVYISDIIKAGEKISKQNEHIVIKGWLYNKRHKGKLYFLQVRDGTGIIQCVLFKDDVSEDVFSLADHLTQESSIEVYGKLREDKRSAIGYEISIDDIKLVSLAKDYPITPKDHGVAFLMDHRHLWLRSIKQNAILSVRNVLIKAIRHYFDSNDFTLIDAPIFTPSACEGTTNLFEVNYFNEKAYLTQSGQLYMEAAAKAFGKVYCFGPTFRAEKSKTRRHLTEFWMVEPEVAFNRLEENVDLAEDFLVFIVQEVLDKCRKEFQILERDTSILENVKKPFPRLHYEDCVKKLNDLNQPFESGNDFGAEDETVLTKQFDKPIIVTHFPAKVKAFYMKKDELQPEYALCVDVLAPEGYGEIIGGGEREDDYNTLIESINKHNLSAEHFNWYLDLRKYGSTHSAGFGLGIERCLAWLCGIPHVRETIPFPRMLERLSP
ncbi:MAG: asparagine--tRNA ligase [Spirochaetota bacterium]|nr:asparagine--tRNA ligase [Spirochaetota bacterium]